MTTFHDPESPLKVARITAFLDTLLSSTEAINMSEAPCFDNARNAFIEQLTDGQLDHIIGRILQLDLTLKGRYDYLDWLREYLEYEEHVDFSECESHPCKPKTFDIMLILFVYFSEHRGAYAQIR